MRYLIVNQSLSIKRYMLTSVTELQSLLAELFSTSRSIYAQSFSYVGWLGGGDSKEPIWNIWFKQGITPTQNY